MRRGFIIAASVVGLLAVVYVTLASPDEPLSREVVTTVFATAGEPLAVRLDMAMGDPSMSSMSPRIKTWRTRPLN
jgi:hypothetical protein